MKLKQFSLIAILTLSAGAVSSASALTYQDEVELQFTWDPVVNISISGDLVISDLSPGSSSDSNIITVTAGSNEANGYTLFGNVGSTTYNYTDLRISPSNSTNKFTNLSTNKATLSNFDENTWGYSYCNATVSSSACDTTSNWVSGSVGSTSAGYNGLPLFNSANTASGVTLADESSASNTTLKFKIGAKASASQAGGTYTNVINFANLAKIVTTSYTLSYVDNSSEATGMPSSSTTGTTTTGAFNVTSTVPSRTNYTFKGWCTVNNSSDPTTCTGTLIQPGGIYAIGSSPATFTGSVYATWQSTVPIVTIATATNMQDVTGCPSSLPTGQVYTLTDSRDGTSYHVAKLADNKCWMLDNLALDLTSSTVLSAMNESNTNASNTTLGYLKNGGGTTSDKYAITGVVNWTDSPTYASSYSYSDPLVNMASKDIVPTSYNGTDDPMKDAVVTGNWKVGGYYNYCAASAGSYCYGNGTSSGTSSGNATEDICPAGWRMPTSNTSGEFQVLYNNSSYNTYANYRAALHLPLSGYFYRGSPYNQGGDGSWRSSTRYSNSSMYYLYATTSTIRPADDGSRNVGSSLRCVAGS